MSNDPSHPSSPVPEKRNGNPGQVDETSGIEAIPQTEETSAFDTHTKPKQNFERSRKKPASSIGGYELGELLGQGGMGRVFRADDSNGRSIALKLLSPDLSRSPEALARFKQEGLIASQINHPHCVFVHRVDDDSGTPFIAMELMTGQTLKDLVLRKGPLPHTEAVRLILQCIDGLIAAHSLGMIHRDIKPANCYLDDDGNVKVGDFGLARSLVSDSELTQTGAFLGTPLFASPEQLLGQTIDTRSDIYSLSATFYYLLAGKAPFESPHAAQVIARIASSDPPPFKDAGVDVPIAIEQIVMKGLSRESSKRFASLTQMRNALQSAIEPKMQPTSLVRRSFAWLVDYFAITAVVAVILSSLNYAKNDSLIPNVFSTLFVALYYLFCESIFSATLGKAALRILVVDAKTGERAGFLKILNRVIVTSLATSLPYIAVKLLYPVLSPDYEALLVCTTLFLNLAFLFSTWWYTKKRQLANDWLSGTECRTRIGSRALVSTAIDLPDWSVPLVSAKVPSFTVPSQLGRFEITGEIQLQDSREGIKWLIAEDKQLERAVWLVCLADKTIEYEKQQLPKPKSLRLRFIEEGIEDSFRWFAYVAPEGLPLMQCAAEGVAFPWPITRSVLGDLSELDVQGSMPTTTLDANRLWIDSVGRLCLVDFVCQESKKVDAVSVIARLGLPTRHRLRKDLIRGKPRSVILPTESLPPLRATKLLESLVLNKAGTTSTRLRSDLERIDKESHALTHSTRFVLAGSSLGLLSPLIFGAMLMFVLPTVVFILNGLYKEVRQARSLAVFSQSPDRFRENWKLLPEETMAQWTDPNKKQQIEDALAIHKERLNNAMNLVGSFERMIVSNVPNGLFNLTSPPVYGPSNPTALDEATDAPASEQTPSIKVNSGPLNVVEINFGSEKVDAELMNSIIGSVERSSQPPVSRRDIPSFAIVGIGVLLCAIWNACTFGGLTRRFIGVCFMKRDGRRLGLLQSSWRAVLLYFPFVVLAYFITECNHGGYDWLWWGTQLKRVFVLIPILYLMTTLIWYRRTLLDYLAGTVAVPK